MSFRTPPQLSTFCWRLIEAGWLVAAMVAPLFFNYHSNKAFELDKLGLLRFLALLMIAVWLIGVAEAGVAAFLADPRSPGPEPKQRPGRKARGQRLASLRPAIRLRRNAWLILVLLLGAAYLLATALSMSPTTSWWGSYSRGQGAYATLAGLAFFLLACHGLRSREQLDRLVFVLLLTSLPVSLYALLQHFGLDPLAWPPGDDGRVTSTQGNALFLAAYLVMVIPLTLARLGRTLGALRGAGKGAGARWVEGAAYAGLLAVQGLAFLFTESRGPALGLLAGLSILALLWAAAHRRKDVAVLALAASLAIAVVIFVLALPAITGLELPDLPLLRRMQGALLSRTAVSRGLMWQSAIDIIADHPERALVGYGPDVIDLVLEPVYTPALLDVIPGRADRTHSALLDGVLAIGFLSTGLYLLLLWYVTWRGLVGLGLVPDRRHAVRLLALVVAGGVFGAVAARVVGGLWGHAAVGLPLGWVAGLGLYLVVYSLSSVERQGGTPRNTAWLSMALLSGLVAHFVESQFSIVVAATQVCFWLFSTTVLRLSQPGFGTAQEHTEQRSGRKQTAPRADAPAEPGQSTLVYGLLVGVMLIAMIYGLVVHDFTLDAAGWAIAAAMAVTWVGGGALAWAWAVRSGDTEEFSWLWYAVVSLGLSLSYLVVHLSTLPRADWTGIIYVFVAYVTLAWLGLGAVLGGGVPRPAGGWLRPQTWAYPLVVVAMLAVGWLTGLRPIRADMYYKAALVAERQGAVGGTIPVLRRAIELAPYRDDYYLSLARASQTRAEASPTLAEQADWWQQAEGALTEAQQLNPINSDYPAALGEVYRIRGEGAAEPVERVRWFEDALKAYRRALELSPERAGRRVDRFVVQTQLELGDAYADLSLSEAAVAAYRQARALEPDDYRVYLRLARVFEEMGRHQEALAEALQAQKLAPDAQRAEIDTLINELGGSP